MHQNVNIHLDLSLLECLNSNKNLERTQFSKKASKLKENEILISIGIRKIPFFLSVEKMVAV